MYITYYVYILNEDQYSSHVYIKHNRRVYLFSGGGNYLNLELNIFCQNNYADSGLEWDDISYIKYLLNYI